MRIIFIYITFVICLAWISCGKVVDSKKLTNNENDMQEVNLNKNLKIDSIMSLYLLDIEADVVFKITQSSINTEDYHQLFSLLSQIKNIDALVSVYNEQKRNISSAEQVPLKEELRISLLNLIENKDIISSDDDIEVILILLKLEILKKVHEDYVLVPKEWSNREQ